MIGFMVVGTGAALGAWFRWGLSSFLNPIFPNLPLGTLVANLTGGFLIGLSFQIISYFYLSNPMLKLFLLTGFLGSLTTFSTFSLESFDLLSNKEFIWMILHASLHLVGSLVMVFFGIFTVNIVKQHFF